MSCSCIYEHQMELEQHMSMHAPLSHINAVTITRVIYDILPVI